MNKLVILLVFILLLLASCAPSETGGKTKVGVIIPLTGDFASFGEPIRQGIEDANQDRVNLVFEDERCNNVQTTNAYHKLTDVDGVKYILGPGCGSPQQIVATFIADKDQIVIVPSAAPLGLYDTSNGKLFQIQYSLEKESAFMADVIKNDGHKNVLLVSYQNAFSQAHSKSFKENFEGNVGEVTFTDLGDDLNIIFPKIEALQPDAIYVADLSFFMQNGLIKLREHNLNLPVYSMYVVEMPFVRELVEGVVYSYPGDIDSEKGGVYSLAYQAADLLFDEIENCNGNYSCVKNALETSPHFDEKGISTRPIELYKIEDGSTVKL